MTWLVLFLSLSLSLSFNFKYLKPSDSDYYFSLGIFISFEDIGNWVLLCIWGTVLTSDLLCISPSELKPRRKESYQGNLQTWGQFSKSILNPRKQFITSRYYLPPPGRSQLEESLDCTSPALGVWKTRVWKANSTGWTVLAYFCSSN